MKRTITFTLAVLAALAMTACGANNENELSESATSTTTPVTDTNTQTTVAETEDTTADEKAPEVTIDYSAAKSQIDEFYASLDGYTSGLIKDDKEASWFSVVSYKDYKSGGSYSDNWRFYVVDENAKQYNSCNELYTTDFKDDEKPIYDYSCRIGNGTFKLYAIYQNDDKGVYFYAEDEVVLDDTTVSEYDGKTSFCYNLTEFIGEDFTRLSFELDNG